MQQVLIPDTRPNRPAAHYVVNKRSLWDIFEGLFNYSSYFYRYENNNAPIASPFSSKQQFG